MAKAIPVRVARQIQDEGLLPRLVKGILTHRTNLDWESQTNLRRLLQGQIGGFRDPLKAPDSLLSPVLLKQVAREPLLGIVLLEIWRSLNSDLVARVRVETRAAPGTKLNLPGVESQDIRLAQLAIDIEVADEELQVQVAPPPIFERVLRELQELPPDAPEWETIEVFVSRLRALAKEKQAHKETARRRRAVADLLQSVRAKEIAGIPCDKWSVEACPENELENAESLLRELENLLEQRISSLFQLQQVSIPIHEQQKLLKQVEGLNNRILTAVEQLTGLLGSPVPPPVETIPSKEEVEDRAGVEEETPPIDKTVLWNLVSRGDLEGAFWFARALEEMKFEPPVPSDILRTLIGSRWLVRGATSAAEFGESLCRAMERPGEEEEAARRSVRALLAAACLVPTLTHPETGAVAFLNLLPAPFDCINPVITAIKNFAARFQDRLRSLDLGTALLERDLVAEIEKQSRNARQWLENAPRRRISGSYLPANLIFWHLVRSDPSASDNLLFQAISPVANDQRDQAPYVRELVRRSSNRVHLNDLIQKLQGKVLADGHTVGRLEGWARDRLIREIEKVLQMADEWADLVLHRSGRQVQDERRRQVNRLVQELSPQLPVVLRKLEGISGDAEITSPARFLKESVEVLQKVLAGQQPDAGQISPWASEGLDAGLAFRLLTFPDILAEDSSGRPCILQSQWKEIIDRLTAGSEVEDIVSLVRKSIGCQDLRWINELMELVPEAMRRVLETEIAQVRSQLSDLQRQLPDLKNQIEQGMLEGSLGPTERAELASEIEQVEATIAKGRVRVDDVRRRIESVKAKLKDFRQKALEERVRGWEELKLRSNKLLSSEEQERITKLVESAFESCNLAVVDEILAQLRQAVERSDRALVQELLASRSVDRRHEVLGEFLKARESIQSLLEKESSLRELGEKIRSRLRLPPELGSINLPRNRYEEVAAAFSAWHSLKEGQPGGQHEMSLFSLLRYLGFQLGDPGRIVRRWQSRDSGLWEAKAATRSPVPEYGSEAVEQLKILVVWARPGTSQLENILRVAGLKESEPVLVLHLGRLLPRQREELASWSFKKGFRGVVLDEILLAFLAREYGVRLDAFLQCSLAASAVNPYRPDWGDNLPPEMFFGRWQMVSDLMDPQGPIYVYGGRRLGKSSLLARVRHEFHRPDQKRYAFFLNIKLVGDPSGIYPEPELIWTRINDALNSVSRFAPARKPETVYEHLARFLRSDDKVRVLLLLDEADAFLLSDSRNQFANVSLMNQLMIETQRRLKVIFAGLHNVRRFRHIPNQPMVGRAVIVGQLEPKDAMALVREPLGVLGYRVKDDALLRILTATNYHPGLIQTLCHRLLNWLRRTEKIPPYSVTLQDVEAVVCNPELQKAVQDRFIWTLTLDPHYNVLVRAMVYDQMERPDGFAKVYSLGELREIASSWWRRGFTHLGADQVRSYAEELKDMGVLVESGTGFRLRSPNLVRLLGTREELEEELLRAEQQTTDLEELENADEMHPQIGQHPALMYSPLTSGQLRRIGIGETGMTLIVGSAATGIDRVGQALKTLANIRGDFTVEGLPEKPDDWISSLSYFMQRQSSMILLGVVRGRNEHEVVEIIRGVLESVNTLSDRTKQHWIRILLSLNHDGIDQWVKLPGLERSALENAAGLTILKPWSRRALTRMFEEQEIHGQQDRGLYPVTCGYQLLVDEVLARLRHGAEPRQVADELRRELFEGEQLLGQRFMDAIGLGPSAPLREPAQYVANLLEPDRPEDQSALISLIADGLNQQHEVAAGYFTALVYRGLLVRDQDKVVMPSVPYRLLKGREDR